MSFEQLENKGFAFLNVEKLKSTKRQLVVLGVARGGTSLVAGALHHLGIFTGEKSSPPVFEDVLLSNAFEGNKKSEVKSIVNKYTSEHSLWAWKRPAALNYINDVEEALSDPFFIIVFKDIFSIANRNNISMMSDLKKGLENALIDYLKLIDFISRTDRPVMLVSAEKALQNKEIFVDALIEINKDYIDLSSGRGKAINFISPNPKNYLDATRITKSKGCIDLLDRSIVKGWAKSIHNSAPVNIEIYVNDSLIKKTPANLFRADLKSKGIHPDGLCAFSYSWNELDLPVGEFRVEAKVEGDVFFLSGGGVVP